MRCDSCGRPKLLDAFSGEGGAGKGYQLAGFCTDAVDCVQDRKTSKGKAARLVHYPRDCEGQKLICGDAVQYIADYGRKYAAVHASPPCTGYSQGTSAIPDRVAKYDRLIPATREALMMTGRPYVIENVTSKVTRAELRDPIMLCWTSFYRPGSVVDEDETPLWMRRHRLFESNAFLMYPSIGCDHRPDMQCAGAYGGARRDKWEARHVRKGGYAPSAAVMRRLLGTHWMTEEGCKLSIPPAYSAFIGGQLIAHLRSALALGIENWLETA